MAGRRVFTAPQGSPTTLLPAPCAYQMRRETTLLGRKELSGSISERTTLSPRTCKVPWAGRGRAGMKSQCLPLAWGDTWVQQGQDRRAKGEGRRLISGPIALASLLPCLLPLLTGLCREAGVLKGVLQGCWPPSQEKAQLSRCQGPHHSPLWIPEGWPGPGGRQGGTDTRTDQELPSHPWVGAGEGSPRGRKKGRKHK